MKLFITCVFVLLVSGFVSAIPNPAPIYCENMGYTIEGEYCVFPDGERCEQWAFYDGECGQEHVRELPCRETGGVLTPGFECCEGLKGIGPKTLLPDGTCDAIGGAWGICFPCGDGLCNETYEDRCNCAEDCDTHQVPQGCPEDARTCPDGSTVVRNPNLDSEFNPCPKIEVKENLLQRVINWFKGLFR